MVNSEDLANILIGAGVAIILFIALLFFFFVFIPMVMKKTRIKTNTHQDLLNKFDNELSESERNKFFNYFDRYIQNVKNSQMESDVVSPTSEFNF